MSGSLRHGTAFSYQRLADGVAIPGATATTLVPGAAQVGKQISIRVTGVKSGYATVVRISASSLRVALTAVPLIDGVVAVGSVLTGSPGTWTDGTALAYQWYADGAAVAGETNPTFTLTAAQAGMTIRVRVTGSLAGYPTVAHDSAATAPVP